MVAILRLLLLIIVTFALVSPSGHAAASASPALEIEGECVRELSNTNLFVTRPGAKVSPDSLRAVIRFQLYLDGCRWLLRQRYSADEYRSEVLHFSDGEDFFALTGTETNRAASISRGAIPMGGMGDLQAVWYSLCRPLCPSLDWRHLTNVPHLLALQDRIQKVYDQVVIVTNAQGRVDEAEMYVDIDRQPVLVDKFTFQQHPDVSLGIPSEAVRQVYALDAIQRTNVPAMRYTVTVQSVKKLASPLLLPQLNSRTRIVDYRLVPAQGEGWFVDYFSTRWRSQEELLADEDILAKVKRLQVEVKNFDRTRKERETRIVVTRALFIGSFVVLLLAVLRVIAKRRRSNLA